MKCPQHPNKKLISTNPDRSGSCYLCNWNWTQEVSALDCFESNQDSAFKSFYKTANKTFLILKLKHSEFQFWISDSSGFWVRVVQQTGQIYDGHSTKITPLKFENVFEEITDPKVLECLLFNLNLFKGT